MRQTTLRRSGAPRRAASAAWSSSTSSRLIWASRACSRASDSAREPWPERIASISARCWNCATTRISRARQQRVRRQQRARRGEGQDHRVLDRALERGAVREPDQLLVVGVVELDVPDQRLRRQLGHDAVELFGGGDQHVELLVCAQALRREPGGGALEDAAQLDRVGDVRAGERADHEAAAAQRLEQALVRQRPERDPERRPRDPEPLGQRDLGDALAGAQLTLEDELPHPQRGLRGLRASGCPGHRASIRRSLFACNSYGERRISAAEAT